MKSKQFMVAKVVARLLVPTIRFVSIRYGCKNKKKNHGSCWAGSLAFQFSVDGTYVHTYIQNIDAMRGGMGMGG